MRWVVTSSAGALRGRIELREEALLKKRAAEKFPFRC